MLRSVEHEKSFITSGPGSHETPDAEFRSAKLTS